MLVPGYINPESVKALAKLSGMDPTEAKYKRPDSPRSRKAAGQTAKSVIGGGASQSVAAGTYSTLGESVNYVSQRNGLMNQPSNSNYNQHQKRQTAAVKGSNADPLSTKFTREDVGRIERHAGETDNHTVLTTVGGISP